MPQPLGQRITCSRHEADGLSVERTFVLQIDRSPEHVDAGGDVTVHEVGLGEAQIDLLAAFGNRKREPELLSSAEQIALPNGDVAKHTLGGRDAGAEAELARGHFADLHRKDGAVRCSAFAGVDIDLAEEAEVHDALSRAANEGRVEGISLRQPELATNYLVKGADIADDVDALDIDPRAPRRLRR